MLVVDEAHRAQGDYAYCQVVRELVRSGGMFRVCGKRYNLFLEFLFFSSSANANKSTNSLYYSSSTRCLNSTSAKLILPAVRKTFSTTKKSESFARQTIQGKDKCSLLPETTNLTITDKIKRNQTCLSPCCPACVRAVQCVACARTFEPVRALI